MFHQINNVIGVDPELYEYLLMVDADTKVPVLAPEHFMQHAVSENVYAGTAMLRRGMYYSGDALAVGPDGRVGMGLGVHHPPLLDMQLFRVRVHHVLD